MKDRDKIIEVLNKYGKKDKAFGGSYISYMDYEAVADELLEQEPIDEEQMQIDKDIRSLDKIENK